MIRVLVIEVGCGSAHKADEAKQGPLPSGLTCDVRRMRAAEA